MDLERCHKVWFNFDGFRKVEYVCGLIGVAFDAAQGREGGGS